MAVDVARTIFELAQQAEQQQHRDMLQKRAFALRFYTQGTNMRDVVSLASDKGCFGTLRVAFDPEGDVQVSYQTGKKTRFTKAVTVPYGQLEYVLDCLLAELSKLTCMTQWTCNPRKLWLSLALFQTSSAEVVVRT
jgi:hypothetical protein